MRLTRRATAQPPGRECSPGIPKLFRFAIGCYGTLGERSLPGKDSLAPSPMRGLPAVHRVVAVWLILQSAVLGATLQLAVRHTFHGDPLLLDSLRYENA